MRGLNVYDYFKIVVAMTIIIWLVGGVVAFAQDTEELEVGTIVVHEYDFGANKRDVRERRYVIQNVDPLACIQKAADLQVALRSREGTAANNVGNTKWTPISTASCSRSLHLVPSQTITVGTMCTIVYDASKSYLVQMDEQCSAL